MDAIIQAGKKAKTKAAILKGRDAIPPENVSGELEKHILVDGFKLVFDIAKSHGSHFYDAASGRELIDLYSFYASQPVGFNHPYFERPEVKADLLPLR